MKQMVEYDLGIDNIIYLSLTASVYYMMGLNLAGAPLNLCNEDSRICASCDL